MINKMQMALMLVVLASRETMMTRVMPVVTTPKHLMGDQLQQMQSYLIVQSVRRRKEVTLMATVIVSQMAMLCFVLAQIYQMAIVIQGPMRREKAQSSQMHKPSLMTTDTTRSMWLKGQVN